MVVAKDMFVTVASDSSRVAYVRKKALQFLDAFHILEGELAFTDDLRSDNTVIGKLGHIRRRFEPLLEC